MLAVVQVVLALEEMARVVVQGVIEQITRLQARHQVQKVLAAVGLLRLLLPQLWERLIQSRSVREVLVLQLTQQEETVAHRCFLLSQRQAVAVAGRRQVWLEILVAQVAVAAALLVPVGPELLAKDLLEAQMVVAVVVVVLLKPVGQTVLEKVGMVISQTLLALLFSALAVVVGVALQVLGTQEVRVAVETDLEIVQVSLVPVTHLQAAAVAVVALVLWRALGAPVLSSCECLTQSVLCSQAE